MDIWHKLGRIFRLSNLGTLIFFLLNITLLGFLFFPNGLTAETAAILLVCYFASVLLSLSPVGEWFLGCLAGAREIKRRDIQIRLIPLLEIVFEQAKARTPDMTGTLHLKMIRDPAPNAYAIGRKTICVTEGLLNLSDEEIMAVFAHELGHVAYKHSTIQLLIGGGNVLLAGCLLIVKLVCWMITGLFTLFALGSGQLGRGLEITLVGGISTGLIWLWTRFCMLFLMWSMRQNEYVADEYAFHLGYGALLASVLDRHMHSAPSNGLLKALYATHPHTDDRIARLQELGAEYSRF